MTALVAGIKFTYVAEGCSFRDGCLRGFGVSADAEVPAGDCVTVNVHIVPDIAIPDKSDIRFHAHKEATEDNFRTDWYISTLPDGGEVLTQCCGEEVGVRGVRLVINDDACRGCIADLSICYEKEPTDGVDPFVYPAANIFLSRILMRRGGVLIHSSVVADRNGDGYLFTAVSGTGKSTSARIFESEGATIVNDDMLALRPSADGGSTVAYSIPMPFYAQTPRSVALRGLFAIFQSKENVITRIRGAAAVSKIMSNVVLQPFDKASAQMSLDNAIACFQRIPTFSLGFKPDRDVVALVRNTMSSISAE